MYRVPNFETFSLKIFKIFYRTGLSLFPFALWIPFLLLFSLISYIALITLNGDTILQKILKRSGVLLVDADHRWRDQIRRQYLLRSSCHYRKWVNPI